MPNNVHELFAYLIVSDAAAAIRYYCEVFGAKERFRLSEPSGRVGHAELDFGGVVLMLADEFPEYGICSPKTVGGSSVTIHLHVDNADEMIARAVKAGATLQNPIADHFYGERSGAVIDPFGHRWGIGHSIEQVTPEEMQRRYTAMMQQGS
ncbi:MAG: VOC family protein [Bryobacterales bacterium]|nr:VOC family protein [Bryobacterales bacterium]